MRDINIPSQEREAESEAVTVVNEAENTIRIETINKVMWMSSMLF